MTYLPARRWFRGNGRHIKAVSIVETIPVEVAATESCITQVLVEYTEEDPELYLLPLSFAWADRADQLRETAAESIVAELQVTTKEKVRAGVIYDALLDKEFCATLLDMILRKKQVHGNKGDLVAVPGKVAPDVLQLPSTSLEVSSMRAEQTNSSIVYGDRFILKVFRKLEDGI